MAHGCLFQEGGIGDVERIMRWCGSCTVQLLVAATTRGEAYARMKMPCLSACRGYVPRSDRVNEVAPLAPRS